MADQREDCAERAGALRLRLGKELGLIDEQRYDFVWVTDFPMFEYSEEEGRYVAAHHPFTAPKPEDVDKLMDDQANCCSARLRPRAQRL